MVHKQIHIEKGFPYERSQATIAYASHQRTRCNSCKQTLESEHLSQQESRDT